MAKQTEKKYNPFYLVRNNGTLLTTRTIIVFPFSTRKEGYAAHEREQTDESARLNIVFENGEFVPKTDVQQWVLENYHKGGEYVYNGITRFMAANDHLLFSVTDTLPTNLKTNEDLLSARTEVREVTKEVFPRVLIESVSPDILIDMLAQKNHALDPSTEKEMIIKYMEENGLISD